MKHFIIALLTLVFALPPISAWASIVGSWQNPTYPATAANPFILVFLENGFYIHYQKYDPASPDPSPYSSPGVEYGTYTWDSVTEMLTINSVEYDENGEIGMSEWLNTTQPATVSGDTINMGFPGDSWSGTRVTSSTSAIVGSWDSYSEPSTTNNPWAFTLYDNGFYLMYQIGDGSGDCITGVEYGTYNWNTNTGQFLATVTYETDGTCGFSKANDVFIRVSGNLMTLTSSDGVIHSLDRVKANNVINILNSPSLSTPTDGAINTSLTSTLTTGPFSDSDSGGTHYGTDWYLSTSADFTSYILSETSNTNLTTFTIPDGTLDEGTTYYWKAKFYDQNNNSSEFSSTFSFTTLTTEVNTAPIPPTLSSPPNSESSTSLTPTLTTTAFSDTNSGDTHLKTDWQISESSNFTTQILAESSNTNLTTLTVPAGTLNEGTTYYWRARHYDQANNASGWSSTSLFTTLTTQKDTNNNGIPDLQEVSATVDIDNDGEADNTQDDIKTLNTVVGNAQLGISRKTAPTINDIVKVESIDPETISDVAIPYSMPAGMVSIKLDVEVGSAVELTIYFSNAAPSQAIWLMYDTINGWTDYSDYATFASSRMSVVLQLKDGGYGDADGVANGIIVDPGGYGLTSFISGTVTNSIGSIITNAEVTFTRNLTTLSFALKSLSDGTFFSALLPGDYAVDVSAAGYSSSSSSITIPEAIITKSVDFSLTSSITAPTVTVSVMGKTVTASWSTVSNASSYTLYYAPAPYEGEDTIESINMDGSTSISVELPSGAAFYVAITSWGGGIESGYSNIGYFEIQ